MADIIPGSATSPQLTGGDSWPTPVVQTARPDIAPPQPSQPAAPAQPREDPRVREDGDRVQILGTKTFKELKDRERERGRRDAMADLNAKAKAIGYDSFDAMALAAAEAKEAKQRPARPTKPARQPPVATAPGQDLPPAPPRNKADRKEWSRYERDKQQWQAQSQAQAQELKRARRRAKELEDERASREARYQLEKTAIGVGVKEVDYAVDLMYRETQRKQDEDEAAWHQRLNALDERKFFEDLRGSKPYLFGEIVMPANTGHGSAAPAPARPGEAIRHEIEAGKFDARKATKEEYSTYLRSKGLTPPSN
jgi:hypothetical protein